MNILSGLLGLLVVGIGVWGIYHSIKLQMRGIFVIGTITKVELSGRGAIVRISFKTARKKEYVFSTHVGLIGMGPLIYKVGNSIMVLYNRDNPLDATIYSWDSIWLVPLACIGIGILFIYSSFIHK